MRRKMRADKKTGAFGGKSIQTGSSMDESVRKSCWGVTAWAVIGFAGIIALALLLGDAETAAVLAAN